MKFSVIIPLYNKAPYVAKAIGSVLAQSFNDYELIIVDDGSKDKSAEIAAKAIEGQSNCHLVRQENVGVSMSRNNGVAASQGDYLCFLDADDWWEPTFLEEMSKLIEEFPDAGIYGTNYTIVSEHNHKTRVASVGVEEGFEKGYINYCKAYVKTKYMPLWTGAVCIPRTVFNEMQGFKPQLKMGEDFDLWIRIALKHKVAFLNKSMAYYNQDVEANNRAIGTLPPPKSQFAFCAGYLDEEKKRFPELKYTVEMVQIACLRSYYLSKDYHKKAKEVLETLDLAAHNGQEYAGYLCRPAWMTVMEERLFSFLNRLKWK
jgi:cellulose synthase/poly-beta-1,6-N-acetylglucosamine synthase-like glycosyltransferase